MSKETDDALKGIMEAIEYLVNEKISSIPFDRTEVAVVTEVISAKKYKVKFNNVEYILPMYGDKTPLVNEIVKVNIPKNNLALAYIF